MIKVLLTDDHALVRTGIKRLLEDSKQVEVIGEADSGEASLILSQELNPDVILMDVNMPGIGGVEASRRILQRSTGRGLQRGPRLSWSGAVRADVFRRPSGISPLSIFSAQNPLHEINSLVRLV